MSDAAPARRVAYRVVRRVAEEGAYADRAFHAEADGLHDRDRALAMQLAYGTVQRRRTLDHLIAQLADRPAAKLDAPIRAALELGLYQLAFLSGIPAHAAVHESVELAKRHARAGHGLVNAVLRRAAGQRRTLLDDLTDETPQRAALKHSVPDWLAELWWRELGPDEARALLAQINAPPESALRINTLNSPEDLQLPVANRQAPELPEGRILEGPFDVFGSPLWQDGLIVPQSRASMLVARTLDPQSGEHVLDLCAAPGGKTTHLAALMNGTGEITAIEVHPGRAAALKRTCDRTKARNVEVRTLDAARFTARQPYDRVLVDPPCSGLGTLQSRPDLRWQERRAAIAELAARQLELLHAGARALKPEGTIVYSVCTISRAESEDVTDAFLAGSDGAFALEASRQLLPHRDGTDGFYIARLRRIGPAGSA